MGNAESGPEVAQTSEVAVAVASHSVDLKDQNSRTSVTISPHAHVDHTPNEEDIRQPAHNHQNDGRATMQKRESATSQQQRDDKFEDAISSGLESNHNLHSIPIERFASPTDTGELQQSVSLFQSSNSDDESEEENEIDKLRRSIDSLGLDVIEAAAAVFHYLETKSMEDDMSASGRSRQVLRMIKKESKKGNTQPAYKFLETAKAVSEILDEDDEDDNSHSVVSSAISAQSPAIFHLINEDDQHSISEQSAAIFKILEDARPVDGGEAMTENPKTIKSMDPPGGGGSHATKKESNYCLGTDWWLQLSPKSQATEKASGAGSTVLNKASVPRNSKYNDRFLTDIPEAKSTADETEALSQEEERIGFIGSDPDKQGKALRTFSTEKDLPVIRPNWTNQENSVDITDLPHLHEIDTDLDLEFVENFDCAYNQFIAGHPRFHAMNPDLVQNLRIYKLQKLLGHNDLLERNLKSRLDEMQEEKLKMEETMQVQLRDAARKKAARQTFLQSELNNLGWSTNRLEAQLRWKSFEYSKDRAKRQFQLRRQFKSIPQAHTLHELIQMIPEGADGQQLRDAAGTIQYVEGSSPFTLSAKQEGELRKFQVENSVIRAEIATLSRRLVLLQMEAKKYTWVESILVKLDEATLFHLKQKFQNKEGLPGL